MVYYYLNVNIDEILWYTLYSVYLLISNGLFGHHMVIIMYFFIYY